jgi:ferredoxin-NADP reductase
MQHGPGMHMGVVAKQIVSFETVFKSKRLIAERTYEYTFEKPKEIHFQAGQHVRMSLINPSETDAKGDKRFLTMASTPQDSELVYAWRDSDSSFKRIMHNMQPGTKILVQKRQGEAPQGSFVLHEDVSLPAVFVAGGIGIVPAYTMIKDAMQRGLTHKMFLFYSNRRPEDAPYLAELQVLAKQNPNFIFVPTITQPENSAQKWQGETGFINRLMIEKYVTDTSAPIYYVSGLLAMVNAVRAVLNELGIAKDNIRAEEFDGFKMGEGAHDMESASKSGGANHLVIGLIVVFVIAMIVAHVSGASHINFSKLSLDSPLTYLISLVVLSVIAFKVFMIMKLKKMMHQNIGSKNVPRQIIEAHKPTRKH